MSEQSSHATAVEIAKPSGAPSNICHQGRQWYLVRSPTLSSIYQLTISSIKQPQLHALATNSQPGAASIICLQTTADSQVLNLA